MKPLAQGREGTSAFFCVFLALFLRMQLLLTTPTQLHPWRREVVVRLLPEGATVNQAGPSSASAAFFLTLSKFRGLAN